MAKKTFFFSHDANARNDEKILAVRMKHGMEGYGIYFAIIEKLLESTDYILLKDYNMIAFELRTSAEKAKSVIEDFGLFEFTECGKLFYSKSLIDRMDALEEKRDKRREAGKKGAESRWRNKGKIANAILNDSNAITKPPKKIPIMLISIFFISSSSYIGVCNTLYSITILSTLLVISASPIKTSSLIKTIGVYLLDVGTSSFSQYVLK